MSGKVKVAVVQAAPILFDKEACVEKTVLLARQAAEDGARVIVFPESFIPGYPQVLDFGVRSDRHSTDERKLYRRFFENSITDHGPEVLALSAAAAEAKAYLAVGVTERDGSNLYCSVFFWGPDGAWLGKHRKLKPTGFERMVWSQGDGSILTALETPYGKMGSAICWENYMPLLRAAMYAKGVSLYLAPTADSQPRWQSTVQHIALEGRCFVLSCNHLLPSSMLPPDLVGAYGGLPDLDQMYCGGSAIINPMGEYLAGPLYGQEGILTAELDLGQIYEARYDFDSVGHFARNDVFTLIVDERPQKGTEFIQSSEAVDQ